MDAAKDIYELRAEELENEQNDRRGCYKNKDQFDSDPFEIGQRDLIARYRRISKTWFRPSFLNKK